VNTTVETFARQHDNVLLMKSDLRVRDVLAYFIICRADLAVIKLTFLQKLLLGIADDASEGLVHSGPHRSLPLTLLTCDFLTELLRNF